MECDLNKKVRGHSEQCRWFGETCPVEAMHSLCCSLPLSVPSRGFGLELAVVNAYGFKCYEHSYVLT